MTSLPVQFPPNFDDIISRSEALHRAELIEANEAFAAAMVKAGNSKRHGAEKITPGTFVDTSPWVGKIIRGEAPMSVLGSPAAMCAENGGPTGDRVLL